MIRVVNLIKSFGVLQVLKGISLQINRGEIVALLGKNGAGKTTFIKILATLSQPSSGAIQIAGMDLKLRANSVRQKLGLLSHNPFLYGDLSAEENLNFFGKMYGVPSLKERIAELLDRVELTTRRYDLVRTFSRGMQQRLAIARAILHQPQILLLDEPFTGLDVNAGRILTDLLHSLQAQGLTILSSTHQVDFALKHCDRVLVLNEGILALDEASKSASTMKIHDLLGRRGKEP